MPFDALSSTRAPADRGNRAATRPIALWLLTVAGMVWVVVALGGATRLTGSGLSIMEWAPIMGTLPPWSDAEWQRLYDLYRAIPQYQLQNAGFGMEGFQRIFWLEWAHRFWGRVIGLAYLLPFLWFWAAVVSFGLLAVGLRASRTVVVVVRERVRVPKIPRVTSRPSCVAADLRNDLTTGDPNAFSRNPGSSRSGSGSYTGGGV